MTQTTSHSVVHSDAQGDANAIASGSNSPESADLLPPWTYQSPAFLQLEIEHLFKRHWMLVGHESDIREPGSFLTFDAFDEQVLVIRGRDQKINAFHNVCRHRGGRVVADESGRCRGALTCPFHGWSYDFDGKLLNIPSESTFPDIQKDTISLATVEHEVWFGFIFIRLQSGGQSVAEQLKSVEDEVALYKPESLEAISPVSVETKPFNWKCIHDIDNEGYHVPVGHPSLNELYGETYKDTIENGIMVARGDISSKIARNWSVRNYQKLLPEYAHLPKEKQRSWFYLMSYPNLIFGFYPDMMEIYFTLPETVNSTRYISRAYALPDTRREARAARYLNVRINNETVEEDDTYIGYLQQGMKSSAWQEPQLSSLEEGVRYFHHCIQQSLPVGRMRTAPQESAMHDTNQTMLANTGVNSG